MKKSQEPGEIWTLDLMIMMQVLYCRATTSAQVGFTSFFFSWSFLLSRKVVFSMPISEEGLCKLKQLFVIFRVVKGDATMVDLV